MKISTKGRYALTIMRNLAKNYDKEEYISLSEISEEENISLKYLEKIMINLKIRFFYHRQGKRRRIQIKKESKGLYHWRNCKSSR